MTPPLDQSEDHHKEAGALDKPQGRFLKHVALHRCGIARPREPAAAQGRREAYLAASHPTCRRILECFEFRQSAYEAFSQRRRARCADRESSLYSLDQSTPLPVKKGCGRVGQVPGLEQTTRGDDLRGVLRACNEETTEGRAARPPRDASSNDGAGLVL